MWLKSEPSLEWLLPLWSEPKLQSRECLKPAARSRSDLRIIFFPLNFIASSAHPSHSFQISKPQLKLITALSLMFPQHDFFLVAHIFLHLFAWHLAFPTFSCFSFSSFPIPSCASRSYIPSAHSKHCCYGCYPLYWPWYSSQAPWILSLVALIPLHQTHTLFPPGCLSGFFVILISYTNMLPSSQILHYHPWILLNKTLENFYAFFCFDLLNKYKSRQV